jgi:cytochrome c1
VFIGGVSGNSPDNLVQWIVTPQKFSPRSAMPATGILEAEARDVAAYLYTQ